MQSDSGKLFVGGISWDTNEERLKDYFNSFGEVVEAVIMKDRTTGRARGFGFIVFADPAVAEIVVREKHNIDGRMVEAKKAVPREDQNIMSRTSGSIQGSPVHGRTRKIFVGGLASTVTESDFKRYFDQFGTITDVVVMYDHNTQRPRGFGFITYDSEEAVDMVLLKTFHELNGKIVEVKRAVPKELSPSPSRSPLGYNYGMSRVNNFLTGYTPNLVGNYGVRMDGRFSPVSSGRSGFPPFGSNYGIGVNFDSGLNPGFGGSTNNFNSNLSYGRGLSPYHVNNSNSFGSPVGYEGSNGGNSSFFSSGSRNLWGTEGPNYGTNSTNSNAYIESRSSSLGLSTFGNTRVNWDSTTLSAQGYGRKTGTSMPLTSSYAATNGGFNGNLTEFYSGGSVYGDPIWQSSSSDREGIDPFDYRLGHASSDVSARSPAGYVGGYSANKRQPNRGITT